MSLKNKLKELAFNFIDTHSEFDIEFVLDSIENWPSITSQIDEHEVEEELNTENIEFVSITDDTLIIRAGGDWQEPYELTIILDSDGETITCSNYEPAPFTDEMDEMQFLDSLFDGNARGLFGDLDWEETSGEPSANTPTTSREAGERLPFSQYVNNNNHHPDNEIVNKIDDNRFPFSENNFFRYNAAKLGADEFSRCIELYERRVPNGGSPEDAMRLMMDIIATEQPNKEELEDLAINLVRELYNVPDSIDLRAMLQNQDAGGELGEHEPEEEPSEERKRELQPEIEKRVILNSIVHGCAVHQWTSVYYQVENELNEINPDLLEKYNRVSALVNYWNWKMYYEPLIEQGHMPVTQGANKVNVEEKKVEATAINFPVLIHELSKGVMDYIISNGLPKRVASTDVTPDELRYIYKQADKYSHEQWHYFFGPTLWRALLTTADVTSQDLPPIISKMSEMRYSELADFCIDVVFDSENSGKDKMSNLMEKTH